MPVSAFWLEVQRRVRDRAPQALTVYFVLETLSLAYDAITYPERLPIALPVWLICVLVAVSARAAIVRWPRRSVETMAVAVAVAGANIVAYHVASHASAEWCLLVLTGLLCAAALFFPWGWRAQLVASSGAAVGYPLGLWLGMQSQNPELTALTYLACVLGLSCYGAEISQSQLRQSFYLTRGVAARETRLRSYLEQALIGIGVIAPNGTWREVNAALCEMVGRSVDEMIGRPWSELLASAPAPEVEAAAGDLVCAGPLTRDAQLVGRDGARVDVCISFRPLRAADGMPADVLLMILDITDRKRAQAESERARDLAESAYRSKSEFLAHMSHELRTPMNIIFGMTEMAMDEASSDRQREVLGRTREAAKSLLVLVDEVLDLSRIERGKVRIKTRAFSLREWLGGVVDPMRTLADAKGLKLSWAVDSEVHDRVVGDPDRMRQVLVNLIGNAIKFTERGEVRVRVRRGASATSTRGELEFAVEDTGPGIPAQYRARIFEAFVQATDDAIGTGLGLAISSHLVELMGGRIWVESEDGAGSRFHFTAPEAGASAN